MYKILKTTDLRMGDILLFHCTSGPYTFVGIIEELIRILTDSDIAHTALCIKDGDDPLIAHECRGGLQVNNLKSFLKDTYVYVVRMRDKNLNMHMVVDTANQLLSEKHPFAYYAFLLLAFNSLYAHSSWKNPKTKKIVKVIIEIATAQILRWVGKRMYKGNTHMECAQFAFDCYYRTGVQLNDNRYWIQKKEMFQEKNTTSKTSLYSIKALLRESENTYNKDVLSISSAVDRYDREDNDVVIHEMCKELISTVKTGGIEQCSSIQENVDTTVSLRKFVYSLDMAGIGPKHLEESSGENGVVFNIVEYLEYMEQFFILPVDFRDNCINTECIGIIPQQPLGMQMI